MMWKSIRKSVDMLHWSIYVIKICYGYTFLAHLEILNMDIMIMKVLVSLREMHFQLMLIFYDIGLLCCNIKKNNRLVNIKDFKLIYSQERHLLNQMGVWIYHLRIVFFIHLLD